MCSLCVDAVVCSLHTCVVPAYLGMEYTVYVDVQGRQIIYRTLDKLVSHVLGVSVCLEPLYFHRGMAENICLNPLFRILSVFRL